MPDSIKHDWEELRAMINRSVAATHREEADILDRFRARLGRDGFSVDEWNALNSAIHELHAEAYRRDAMVDKT